MPIAKSAKAKFMLSLQQEVERKVIFDYDKDYCNQWDKVNVLNLLRIAKEQE